MTNPTAFTNITNWITQNNAIRQVRVPNRFIIRDENVNDLTELSIAIANYNIVYPLETPLEFDLDEPLPTITTLLGNNIWANTGDINEVIYIRDLNIAFNEL